MKSNGLEFLSIASLSLLLVACGEHNPNNPLNPDSQSYVGDSLAKLDLDSNGIADILEQSSSSTDSSSSSSSISFSSSIPVSSSSEKVVSSSSVELPAVPPCGGDSVPVYIVNGYFDPQDTNQLCAAQGENLVAVAQASLTQCFSNWTLPTTISVLSGSDATKDDVIDIKVSLGTIASTWQVVTANFEACPSTSSSSTQSSSSSIIATSSSSIAPSSSAIVSSSSAMTINKGDTLVIDGRDNENYKTVKVGSLVWMKENLRYAISGETAPCAKVVTSPSLTITASESSSDCDETGRYYNWAQAMELSSSYNTTTYDGTISQGICPEGWRLPSSAELRDNYSKISLDTTSVFQSGTAFNTGLYNTGFYWTRDQPGIVNPDQSYCSSGSSSCGIAWIYHKATGSDQNYSQNNTKAEGMPLRCVRSAN